MFTRRFDGDTSFMFSFSFSLPYIPGIERAIYSFLLNLLSLGMDVAGLAMTYHLLVPNNHDC